MTLAAPPARTVAPVLLHEFFDRAALRWPDAIAVDVPPGPGRPERTCATYARLQGEADLLGPALGLVGGEVHAVLLPRTSVQFYAAQLAVLRSGAAFVSLDPAFPDEQLAHILRDARPGALLTDGDGWHRAARIGYSGRVVRVDQPVSRGPDRGPQPERSPQSGPAPARAGRAAYLIYTSGTTGRPKGVVIAHRGICNLVESDLAEFALTPADRVAQGSSAAYDSSVEETWMAWSAGAAVVVMDDATVRLGPDLIGWLGSERVTVLCPPPTLLRATGCTDPDIRLPQLRLLYVGGEPLPADVAECWGRGRRLVNGYGPTECTVTCLRGDVLAGQEISIGHPVPGMQAWVVDESLEPVADGHRGELCVSGAGLALGYRGQDQLTAAKFPHHPRLGRIYRTGDLVHRREDGAFVYHGRIDSQIKLRGYRIELEAIESCLARCEGVREAACRVQGDGTAATLAAHVVAADPARPPDLQELRDQLGAALPGYMVPAYLATITELPRTSGGKLRRDDLPVLTGPTLRRRGGMTPAGTPVERRIADAAREVLAAPADLSVHDDFFADLGGSSLQAAMLISLLRADPATASLTVRDLYETRTVAGLAQRTVPARTRPPMGRHAATAVDGSDAGPDRDDARRAALATIVQGAWLLIELLVASPLAYLAVFVLLPWVAGYTGLVPLILLAPLLLTVVTAALVPLAVLVAVAAKRILIGRYTAMSTPVWGSFYVRSWMVQQVVRIVPWRLIEGTEFQCMALRALGARIGQRVHLHRGVNLTQGGWDLLDIGDDVTVSQDASIHLMSLEAGRLLVGPVRLMEGATLDIRAGVGPHTTVGRNAWLAALSSLPAGGVIPDDERWDGIPATSAGAAPRPPALTRSGRTFTPVRHAALSLLASLALREAMALPLMIAVAWLVQRMALDYNGGLSVLSHPGAHVALLCAAAAVLTASLVCTVLIEAAVARALGRVTEGVISRWSAAYLRVWMKAGIVQGAGTWLSGGLFWPVWLRWAGMAVGSGCEISTIIDVVPELVRIGPDTFLADGIYLGGPRLQCGVVTLAPTSLGRNTFLGNHAVIAAGQRLPDDILLGISTVADDRIVRPGTSWFGHPPFELPRREIVELDRSLTYDPSMIRVVNRMFWEWSRFALPLIPLLVLVAWVASQVAARTRMPFAAFLIVATPAISLASGTALTLVVLAMKWSLLGRVRPGIHALWSCWCSRWDFLYVAWGVIASGVLAPLEGTLFLPIYLRRMGMRIGTRVVLGSGFAQVVDPDMLQIDDGATVNAMFQAHTFEDRVLKIDRVRVGAYSTLGDSTVPLYGADIGAGTYVAPHSVIMKREVLLAGLRYEGAPTRPQQDQDRAGRTLEAPRVIVLPSDPAPLARHVAPR